MTAEGKTIGRAACRSQPAPTICACRPRVNAVGAIALAGKISAAGLGEARFEDAVTLRRPRVLLVSHDPAESEQHLVRTLESNQFEVERAPAGIPDKLDDFQLIVINNWDMESIPLARKAALEEFEKAGGGLLWIAGEHNVYVEKKGQPEDALERTLPAKLAPPRSPEGTAVVLIIDKSSSMEGRKIELARLAAIGVVENLRPIDSVGVLIFDNSFQWAVNLRKADDRAAIKRLIAGITPDGGTQIAPALTEAYQKILALTGRLQTHRAADRRHLRRGRQHDAHQGSGGQPRDHFHRRAGAGRESRVPGEGGRIGAGQIVFPKRPLRAGADSAARRGRAHRLDRGGEAHHAQGAEAGADPGRRGHGDRAAAEGLRALPGSPHGRRRFWRPTTAIRCWCAGSMGLGAQRGVHFRRQGSLGRELGRRGPASTGCGPTSSATFCRTRRRARPRPISTAPLTNWWWSTGWPTDVPEPAEIPDIYALGPDGFQAPLKVDKVAAGHYRGRLAIGQNQGLFRIRPVADSRAFPEVGFYRQEDEMTEYGNNADLLRQIAAATGGRFNPSPRQVFDAGNRSIRATMELWPGAAGAGDPAESGGAGAKKVEGRAGSAASAGADGVIRTLSQTAVAATMRSGVSGTPVRGPARMRSVGLAASSPTAAWSKPRFAFAAA